VSWANNLATLRPTTYAAHAFDTSQLTPHPTPRRIPSTLLHDGINTRDRRSEVHEGSQREYSMRDSSVDVNRAQRTPYAKGSKPDGHDPS
jgi:hypothetical protein